jgi:hypothetical protein
MEQAGAHPGLVNCGHVQQLQVLDEPWDTSREDEQYAVYDGYIGSCPAAAQLTGARSAGQYAPEQLQAHNTSVVVCPALGPLQPGGNTFVAFAAGQFVDLTITASEQVKTVLDHQ